MPALNDLLTPFGAAFEQGAAWGALLSPWRLAAYHPRSRRGDARFACSQPPLRAAALVCAPRPTGALEAEVEVPGLQAFHMASGVPIKALPGGAWIHRSKEKAKQPGAAARRRGGALQGGGAAPCS